MFGGEGREPPRLELVRLAIPRRMYTQSHMDYTVEAVIELYGRRHELRGMHITNDTGALRHFQAEFEEI